MFFLISCIPNFLVQSNVNSYYAPWNRYTIPESPVQQISPLNNTKYPTTQTCLSLGSTVSSKLAITNTSFLCTADCPPDYLTNATSSVCYGDWGRNILAHRGSPAVCGYAPNYAWSNTVNNITNVVNQFIPAQSSYGTETISTPLTAQNGAPFLPWVQLVERSCDTLLQAMCKVCVFPASSSTYAGLV